MSATLHQGQRHKAALTDAPGAWRDSNSIQLAAVSPLGGPTRSQRPVARNYAALIRVAEKAALIVVSLFFGIVFAIPVLAILFICFLE
jgi:hypothetical protein